MKKNCNLRNYGWFLKNWSDDKIAKFARCMSHDHIGWQPLFKTPKNSHACLLRTLTMPKLYWFILFFVIPALFISLSTIFSYFFYFSVQIKEPANESSTIRGHSIDRGMHHSTYPEERGLFFRGYRKSSNIRCPQKIVAPNFSWFLIGCIGRPTRPFFKFKPFLKPFDQGL